MTLLQLLLLAAVPLVAHSHSRWECPAPRSSSTGIKNGPCGSQPLSLYQSDAATEEIKPGPLRIIFEESIHHTGSPFRISLSNDGTDDDACVLLDHIPHNDCCRPGFFDESSYTKYVVTIEIPNVKCERCSLHLSNPMTDKIGSDGSPSGIGCTDPDGSCFSVYYSCTEPFRIVGDENAVQRNEYACPDWRSVNEDWPLVWVGDNGEDVDVTTSGVYRRESSIWSEDDFTLTTVPNQYRQDAGGLCGEQVTASITSPTTTSADTTATTASSLTNGTTTTTPTAKEGNNESNESKTPPPTSAGIVVASSLILRIMILAGAITFGLQSLIIF
uniref:Chitin-binding type-4 domain-containing protein n=1 Tax=Skeletonema marinoi TaxID=267567 RepID=A0A7S2PN89_9STRA|mmetsp:Transcript_26542/g.45138  ORF Transcript_26542/g.45138 Transcript_26542/m.45138 type:complete len:330 (+) Transcript_26542:62-1051(+)